MSKGFFIDRLHKLTNGKIAQILKTIYLILQEVINYKKG